MKINIYYGGRGVLDDPTLYVLDRIEQVFSELRVNVNRYNVYESKSNIATLPQTLKDVDGIILATTVEWMGIGGFMQQFLDACWLYADKSRIAGMYMMPVVMATAYGEKEAELTLTNAWEMLGGLYCAGLTGYVENVIDFQSNNEYVSIIENRAENMYRAISKKIKNLPSSNQAMAQSVLRTSQLELTPEEGEKLSQYVSDDDYVKQQKEDLAELTQKFKGMVKEAGPRDKESYITDFKTHFKTGIMADVDYSLIIEGQSQTLLIGVHRGELDCRYGQPVKSDIIVNLSPSVMDKLVSGHMTFQRAFMEGALSIKGDFATYRRLDEFFNFALV